MTATSLLPKAAAAVGIIVDGSSPNSAGVTLNGGITNDGKITGTALVGIYLSGNGGNLASGGATTVNGGTQATTRQTIRPMQSICWLHCP